MIATRVTAQNPEAQQRLAEVREAAAKNKQELATYTWQEQDTISLKGEMKKQESYQVQMGADDKPVKTPLNAAPTQQQQPPTQAQGRPQGGRLKEKVVENKKEEYKEYADKIGAGRWPTLTPHQIRRAAASLPAGERETRPRWRARPSPVVDHQLPEA